MTKLKKYSKQNKNRDVLGEYIFRQGLIKYGIHYQRQKVVCKYIVDFYLPKRNLIVEIDGIYHAGCKEYDEMRQKDLERWGWDVLRFFDYQVKNDLKFCIEQILSIKTSSKIYRKNKARLKIVNSKNFKGLNSGSPGNNIEPLS